MAEKWFILTEICFKYWTQMQDLTTWAPFCWPQNLSLKFNGSREMGEMELGHTSRIRMSSVDQKVICCFTTMLPWSKNNLHPMIEFHNALISPWHGRVWFQSFIMMANIIYLHFCGWVIYFINLFVHRTDVFDDITSVCHSLNISLL